MNNNIFMEELFYIVTFPLLLPIIHYFYSHFFFCRIENKFQIALLYSLYFGCHLTLYFSSWPGSVLLTINTGLIAILSFLYRGNLKWRMCTALFIMALILLSDAIMQPVYSTSGYIMTLFLSKLLMLMLVYISVRISHAFGEGSLSGWYWVVLFCCPFISILGIVQLSANQLFRTSPILIPLVSSGLLLINFLIFVLSDRILCVQSAQSKNQLLEQQNTYYINQFQLIKERHEESSTFQHDFKNILLGLRAQLQSGEDDISIKEIDKLLGNVENPSGICNSGNLIIDSIISYKAQVTKRYDIPFFIDLNIPSGLELDTTVISVILGNGLDNAIEACKAKTNIDRYIKLQMHYLNDSLFMRIQNPYVHEIRMNTYGEFFSTKSNAHSRIGIGLKSIKKIVDDSRGLVDVSYSNRLFQLEIVLFNVIIPETTEPKEIRR
ncbi:ATP-binding protein [Paenibacillus oralis]|uniref:ATP-binding protein n=1 Tax=Paenibacillus oralis TaxID=2490856 RepID=A0A3P3U9T7_9BACL|nr:sensor histidine kinase [Paenibacillus oralis]RRJ67117.1 ATP-binding protein [Paenibacillus oralis]